MHIWEHYVNVFHFRYGSVFRTSLVGRKVLVSTDPEINYQIFQQEGKSFLIWYTESFIEILGQQSMLAYHGMVHKYLKNLILHLVSPENLKAKLLHEMSELTRRHLHSWANNNYNGNVVDIKEATSNVSPFTPVLILENKLNSTSYYYFCLDNIIACVFKSYIIDTKIKCTLCFFFSPHITISNATKYSIDIIWFMINYWNINTFLCNLYIWGLFKLSTRLLCWWYWSLNIADDIWIFCQETN